MSPPQASGTLRSILSLCLALSTLLTPTLAAPTHPSPSTPWLPRSLKSLFETRQATTNQCGGTGLVIKNGASAPQTITVFQGKWSIVSDPFTSLTLAAGASQAVPLPDGFIGHVQRGALLPATWVELNMVPGAADGDVSLEIGCDGAATVQATGATDDQTVWGFTTNVNERCSGPNCAPDSAYFVPGSKEQIGGPLTPRTDVLDVAANGAALAFEQQVLSQAMEYLVGGSGTNQAISSNGCLVVTFY
ncbi:hypothetical protein BDR22DRAFT_888283 [Usnea florida]